MSTALLKVASFLFNSQSDENKKIIITTLIASTLAVFMLIFAAPLAVLAVILGSTTNQTNTGSSSDGYNNVYENVIFSDFIYFNQNDVRWGSEMYGTSGTISQGGCGPTSMAIVVSTLSDYVVNPLKMSNWSVENGYRCEGNGSYHSLIPNAGLAYDLTVSELGTSQSAVFETLENGGMVVAIMSAGHFTSGGHFIVLRGVTSDGQILVADPNSYNNTIQAWDPDIIFSEANPFAGSGGPFWGFTT